MYLRENERLSKAAALAGSAAYRLTVRAVVTEEKYYGKNITAAA